MTTTGSSNDISTAMTRPHDIIVTTDINSVSSRESPVDQLWYFPQSSDIITTGGITTTSGITTTTGNTRNKVSNYGRLRMEVDDAHRPYQQPLTLKRFLALVAMAFLWTSSQIPVYVFGGIPPLIYQDIGGTDRWTWFVLANLLASAAVCPFVGSLSDLIGRRYVAILGACLIILGMIVSSTAHHMNIFIAGMAIAGAGAGINELTALAVTSELAPTRKRGTYVAFLVSTIIPFCPSVMWAQLISKDHSWRYCGLLCGVWAFVGLLMTVLFYFPHTRINSRGHSKTQIIKQVDFVGGFLSITGILVFTAGLQWGGYQYPWKSAHVLLPLFIGLLLLVAFVVWESKFANSPMFPARLNQVPRTFTLTLVITFISGANFFSVLLFWPTQAYNVYGHDPVGVGLRGLPIGFSVLAGAVLVLGLLSVWRGRNRVLMIASSIVMTAGIGSLASLKVDTLYRAWGLLVLGGLGIGGIVVPASIITTIICPDDLIATVSALTLAVRVIGGSIGYTVYYNVFLHKFVENSVRYVGGVMTQELGIKSPEAIEDAITLTGASLLEGLMLIPGIRGNQEAYEMVVRAGQIAFAESYRYVYLVSIAFGSVAIIAACFLGNIDEFMDNHVAVVM